MIRLGVIGYGYWGPNLVRNLCDLNECSVVAVADKTPSRLETIQKKHPTIRACADHNDILRDPQIDAVMIATPIATHYELARQALRSGKHVFIEKPMVTNADDGMKLIEDASARGLVIMVGHTFVYSGAVQKIKELVATNTLGQLYYYDSVRINLGLIQQDVDVVWDLAVHDLSIMDYIFPERPTAISATGAGHIPGRPDDIAYLSLYFESGMIAHVHVNWLAPVKIRRTLIGGAQKMIVYDDLEPSEKVKIYDSGVLLTGGPENRHKILIDYRTGDMLAPRLNRTEPLRTELSHFLECIEHRQVPRTDALSGLRIVRILEAANLSMKGRGAPVELKLN